MNQTSVPETALKAGVAAAQAAALQAAEGPQQYLTFMLGAEVFAIEILSIREIIEHAPLTQVPMMPQYVGGVINLRGAVVPVIDLAARLDLGTAQASRRSCVVVVEVPGAESADPAVPADAWRQVIGILVDAVHEVVE
ncbi:MAG TPA: chemotaxis protein CheW, partial [Steroidobacteraceae bacterium]|nr:chemotaxis protein CheW [Steroidobacteraceae bacterium]